DALRILSRLAGFRELPASAAEEAQARLAEVLLRRRRYARARRHLAAALAHQPDNPHYHYLMATALDAGAAADPQRAAAHVRGALGLDPDRPRTLCDFGLAALRLGKTEEGLACLRRALRLAPDDPVVLAKVVKGFRQEGLDDEERNALRAGLFRHPRDA